MEINIAKIAKIQYGTYYKTLEKGDIKYLHVSHFDSFGRLSKFSNSYMVQEKKYQRFILNENDVLLAAKGSRNFAWAYNKQYGNCVPSSAFYIMRLDKDMINGEYLAHYLNTERIQYQLKNMVTGSGMPSIPKKEFLQLNVTVPTLKEQMRIVEVAKLMDEDILLTSGLLLAKKNLKKGLIDKLITNKL